MKISGKTGWVSLWALSKINLRTIKKLKKIYSELCSEGVKTSLEGFFADSFHAVLSKEQKPGKAMKSRFVWAENGTFPAAEKIIECADGFFPSAESGALIISQALSGQILRGPETEYLSETASFCLIEKIYKCLKDNDRALIKYMTLLSELGGLDSAGINSLINPVAIKLREDPAYLKSDSRTRLYYREAVYLCAVKSGSDGVKICERLFEKSGGGDIDIMSLGVISPHRSPWEAVFAAAVLSLVSLGVALSVSYFADALFMTPLLFLPAFEALRPFSDRILYHKRGYERLMRFDPDSEEVKNTKTAVVLSSAVLGAEDAAGLYEKLLRIHCSEPGGNIKICALIDLPPEQAPISSEDRSVTDSLSEVIEKLEKISPNRFSALVRKRTFSETQQEYMGALRKRGALLQLAKYIKTGSGDFCATIGAYKELSGCKYICALDSDTVPLMDGVSSLIGIALHPANRLKTDNGRIISGYGIIAPRMVTRLDESLRTEFSKSLGGIGSRSSYDSEAASLWQDVFGRATFCGKGLINVDALLLTEKKLSGERILSHDILEGELINTAYAGDVCFTEGFPKTPQSYYRRLDRWIRGDFQNIPEIFSKNYDSVSKLKLLDNIRRAMTPVSVFLIMFAGFLLFPPSGAITAAAGLVLWLFPHILGAAFSLIKDRSHGRRFYSGLINSASLSLRNILYSAVMLPTLAVKSLRAALTAIIRLFTGRELLEWTTSDASDRLGTLPLRFYLVPELLSLSLLWSPDYLIRLFGAVFSLMPALLGINSGNIRNEPALGYRDGREISKQVADMWGFFEEYAGPKDNFLPPDNVQFSPVYRVAHRTSPTNIGLYMLSVLAARDRRLLSSEAALDRIEKTLGTVERLEKYRGNLYNWYDTETLEICYPEFVSSVDSGNFAVCMVTLKEGLKEFGARGKALAGRVLGIVNETDLGIFYNPVRGLLAIGIDPKTGEKTRGHYDYLMSEARLASFWAIASRQVPKSHWSRLSRAMLSSGFFSGAASYSGTMFEFFMPELFLKSPEGSLFSESLKYALSVQRRYASSLKRPYGVSESGIYSFDTALNYRYSANGVPKTGIRRGLENNYVVSPYSTYLSLGYAPSEGAENLRLISEYGMKGSFGLYEALDFTYSDSGRPEPVRSYMSHHMGMSILGCDNALTGGIMQKRFMRDLRVKGALELLDERFHLGAAVFENTLRRPALSSPEKPESETETFEDISLSSPRVKLLSNGEMTLTVSDGGLFRALYRSKNLYLPGFDPYSRPQGCFYYFYDGNSLLPFSYLPDKLPGACAEFSEDGAAFYRNTELLSAGMKLRLHQELPCEIKTFAFKNTSGKALDTSVICYIDPCLQSDSDARAHPAYSKMFLRLERDPEYDIITVTRLREDKSVYMGIGFIEDVKKTVSFDRGEALSYPDGLYGLKERFLGIQSSLISEPDPCVFIRAEITIPEGAETEINMFTVCADSKAELINRACAIRRKRLKFSSLPRLDTASGRLTSFLLPKLLYGSGMNREKLNGVMNNSLPLSCLWELSVSTDIPAAVVILNGKNDSGKLSAYLGAYKLISRSGISMQLIFAFDDGGRYEREHYNLLISAAREERCEAQIYSPGGVLPLDLSKVRRGLWELLCAYAFYVCEEDITEREAEPKTAAFKEIKKSLPDEIPLDRPVACGGFSGTSYAINSVPPLPWCHILSNPVFGTLLSSCSLGFTYAFNSRENRLTPWDNDPTRDNRGERLILKIRGEMFDLTDGSAALFSFGKAEYFSHGEGYRAHVTVEVSEKGMSKRIRAEIRTEEKAELAYYTEPCMGVTRAGASMIIPKRTEDGIILHAPASELGGWTYISVKGCVSAVADREKFLSGDWSESVSPCPGLIAAVVCEVSGYRRADFYLSFALCESAAKAMPEYFKEQSFDGKNWMKSGSMDEKTRLITPWLLYQTLHGRIYSRTGFYQCSGAYGFRDQLQDACGIAGAYPGILKSMILRSCMAQFPEGDVLHWRHTLPGKKPRGIRTEISDDPLWLVYAVSRYISVSKDMGILDINVSYCDGIKIPDSKKESYGEVYRTASRESVYMHCKRALASRSGKKGPHGLMLIGAGDWNDGFNSVGKDGKGESVWLSEFYIIVAKSFSETALKMNEKSYAEELIDSAEELEKAIEEYGKDGDRYIRGYFDSGEKLGSEESVCCKIDSVAQSFAQFAGLGSDGFAKKALLRAYSELYDPKRKTVKLFTPAFDTDSEPDPGYVKFYPEGLRENGGQYTHAAVWLAIALKRAGLTEESKNIFDAINPIAHSENGGYLRYKTEPYYLCGDVYTNNNCMGRGGWSIYTGAAGWAFRGLEESEDGIKDAGF